MSFQSCEGLLITSPHISTPPSPFPHHCHSPWKETSKSPCRNWHKPATRTPSAADTGGLPSPTCRQRPPIHPPAARTFILITFCFCTVIILFNNRVFGKGTSIAAEKKKRVFMNNGTFQIHLVSETFFSFLLQPII